MLLQIISAKHMSKDHQRRQDLQKLLENLVQIYKANGVSIMFGFMYISL